MNRPQTNGAAPAPFGAKVKLCGLYKQKRKRDGKTYLVGRNSYSSKLLVLPNDDKKSASEPDFWVFAVEDEVKPKATAPTAAPSTDDGL